MIQVIALLAIVATWAGLEWLDVRKQQARERIMERLRGLTIDMDRSGYGTGRKLIVLQGGRIKYTN